MTGTLINIIAIIIGSSIGLQNAMGSGNIIIPLLSLSFGTIIGELIGVDEALKRFGGWLQTRAATLGGQGTGDLAQLLNLKQPRVANFLPGLLIAPLLVLIANLLGIKVYPF